MTNATKARAGRRREQAAAAPPRRSPWRERGVFAALAMAIAIGAATLWQLRGSEGAPSTDGPVHVHGLGINPGDRALFIATHTGLFRVGESESKAVRVGDSYQDTMGFTIAGDSRFLGSGHPDVRADLPPLLGLIASDDEGRTWKSISLLGDADFHVLRSVDERVYGYDASGDRLMSSEDAGRTWSEVERPAPLLDVAVDPADDLHLLASGASDLAQGLYESRDGGRSWERIGAPFGYLAWPERDELFVVDGDGGVLRSPDGGRRFERRGSIGGQPAALLGEAADELYVALHDGTIKSSNDGGASWAVRSTP